MTDDMSDKRGNKILSLPTPEHPMHFTGERYTPGVQGEIEHEHLHRYLFALQLCTGKDVLDVASGEGYGSALLAQVAHSVVGVDIDAKSVQFAKQTYTRHNLSYMCGSATQMPVADASMDVVVSFETIEHFAEHDGFLREIKRVLKPDGLLVVSSPDRDVYSEGGPTRNPFHIKELDKAEFQRLIKAYFIHAEFGCQKAAAGSLLLPETANLTDIPIPVQVFDRGSNGQLEQSAGVQKGVYLLAVASDRALPLIRWGAYQDVSYLRRLASDLDATKAEVNQLATELEEQVAEAAARTAEVNQLAAELEEQVAEAAARTAEVNQLAAELEEQVAEAAARTAGVDALRHQLEQANKEIASVKRDLAKIKRSFSWRVTRPLRAIVAQTKRLKGRRLPTGLAFDPDWYLKRYPDVAAAGLDPLRHYLKYGRHEGRLGAPERDAFDTVDNGPRLVVLLTDAVERLKLSEKLWSCIRIAAPETYSPGPSDYVYEPTDSGVGLSPNHLHNVLLCLACDEYDFVVISYGLDPLPTVRVNSLRDNLILRGKLRPLLRGESAMPSGARGRILRLLPAPQASEVYTFSIGDLVRAVCTTDGPEVWIGSKRLKAAREGNLEIISRIKAGECAEHHKTVLVLPAFFAVGGVERNTVEIMRNLHDRYRFVVATNEPQNKARGSLHHQLAGLTTGVFDLWEIAAPERHLELLAGLGKIYGVGLIWICNGSPWLASYAKELRETFSMVPIVDQQAYDTKEGWIAHFWNPGIRSFDRFVAINSQIRDTLINRYELPSNRIDLIYSGIDAQRFVCTEQTRSMAKGWAQRALGDGSGRQVFAMIGRLTQQKRPLDFLELALRSKRDGLDVIFILVGDGELTSDCRRFQERHDLDNVRFVDFCEDLTQVYPILSGLIVTSEYEGLPIVALEAMAMGVPVLTTDVGDLRLVFSEHGVGNLFRAIGDPDLQYDDFRAWREELAKATELARTAADRVRERFSSTKIAAEYDACWNRAIAEKTDAAKDPRSSSEGTALSSGGIRVSGLSVVIPTYNRRDVLIETLQRCEQAASGMDVEFVVIDDGSSDGTADSLDQISKSMPALRWSSVDKRGPGQARNIGAATATKDVVLFIGDDIRPASHGFFMTHAQLHSARPESNFAVLGKIIWPNRTEMPVNFVMAHIQGCGGEQFSYAHLMPYTFVDWRHFYTSNVSVKRSVVANWIDEGFSTEFPLAAFEDIEFAYRCSKACDDFRIYYDPTSLGTHYHRYSVDGFMNRQISAGMMAHVFHRLHPEVASSIGINGLLKQLGQTGAAQNHAKFADHLSTIEGIKSYARLIEQRADFGGSYWHDDFLSAVFELAYAQGFVIAAAGPGANLSAGYEYIVDRFVERTRGIFRQEVIGTDLPKPQAVSKRRPRWHGRSGIPRAIAAAIRRPRGSRVS
jgi:glycosyltransferase involved in cell wall biosynthesis/SAM-dependent methyltransferase